MNEPVSVYLSKNRIILLWCGLNVVVPDKSQKVENFYFTCLILYDLQKYFVLNQDAG